MLKIKPEERQKVLLLSASIVLVICMFCFTVIPRLLPHGPNGELLIGAAASAHETASSAPAGGPAASASPSGTAPAAGATMPTPTPAPNANGMAEPLLTGSTTVTDPFWRPLALAGANKRFDNKPNPTPAPPAPVQQDKKPAGYQNGGNPVVGGPRAGLPTIVPPQLPEVELQGIVQDEAAIAVLNVGGQTRFLKAGQPLEAGWVVARIQAASVTLKQGSREVTLNLGQTMQKDPAVSTPKETPQETMGSHRLAETLPPFHSVSLQP